MKDYRFNQLRIGLSESFSVTLTAEMMNSFGSISGDCNPLHLEQEHAIKKGFQGRVAFGMLTSSFYSKLVGVHLPGKHCFLQGINIQFRNPSYIGDQLIITGKVSYLNEAYKQIEIKANIKNQIGVLVSTAKIKVGYSG